MKEVNLKMKEDKKVLNAFALVGFILGLLSVALYWVIGIVPILAIIFSIIGLVSVKKSGHKGKGFAITGLVLGIVFILAFGLQIFLRYNNYFQDNEIIGVYEENSQNNFIGNWEHTEYVQNIRFEANYYIKDYTYTYECKIFVNDVIDEWFMHSGTIQVFGEKALLTKTNYTNMYNSPTDLCQTNHEIEYRDGKLISNYEYERMN